MKFTKRVTKNNGLTVYGKDLTICVKINIPINPLNNVISAHYMEGRERSVMLSVLIWDSEYNIQSLSFKVFNPLGFIGI
jgi:hypothetical protein